MPLNQRYLAPIVLAFMSTIPLWARSDNKPPKTKISMQKARQIAQQVYAGDVKGEELEFENKRWIYSFDLKKADEGNVHEVQIDALSGKLVSETVETAQDEQSEAKTEGREK